jgi:hypothetical protein
MAGRQKGIVHGFWAQVKAPKFARRFIFFSMTAAGELAAIELRTSFIPQQ